MESNSSDKKGLTPTEKLKISLEIKGDNKYDAKNPVFHHIKGVLNKYFLTPKEAREIMLDIQGAYSPELKKNVIYPIIDYLERIDFIPIQKTNQAPTIFFDDIFCNPSDALPSLKVLTMVEPPIIDSDNNYILGERQKGCITAWIEALRQKGIIKNIKDEDLAVLINTKIIGLNLGSEGRTLRNFGTTYYTKYYSALLNLLS